MASDLLGEIVVIKRNGGDGARFPLKAKQCIFGRDPECDIRIQIPQVEEEHAKIYFENGKIWLQNLSGKLPTLLNSQAVDLQEVNHNDVFTITQRSFRFEFPERRKSSTPRRKSSKTPLKALQGSPRTPSAGESLKTSITKLRRNSAAVLEETEPVLSPFLLREKSPKAIAKKEKENTPENELPANTPSILKKKTSAKRSDKKRISFGPNLSPEIFDKTLPPSTPLRKGRSPARRLSEPLKGAIHGSGIKQRYSLGTALGDMPIMEEEEEATVVDLCDTPPENLPAPLLPATAANEAEDSNAEEARPPVNEAGKDAAGEEEGTPKKSMKRGLVVKGCSLATPIRRQIHTGITFKAARRKMNTPLRMEIEAKPKLRSKIKKMATPLRKDIEKRPTLKKTKQKLVTPLRESIHRGVSLRKTKKKLKTPLREEIQKGAKLRQTKPRLPTPLQDEIKSKPALRETKRKMRRSLQDEIIKGKQLQSKFANFKKVPGELLEEIAKGRELTKVLKSAPTPLKKEIKEGVKLKETKKKLCKSLQSEIIDGKRLRKTKLSAPTPLRKAIKEGRKLRKTKRTAPTPLREAIKRGVTLRKTNKKLNDELQAEIKQGKDLKKTKLSAPTPLKDEIKRGVSLRKTKRQLDSDLQKEIRNGKELRKTKKSAPTPFKNEIKKGLKLRATKKKLSQSLQNEIKAGIALAPLLKKALKTPVRNQIKAGVKLRTKKAAKMLCEATNETAQMEPEVLSSRDGDVECVTTALLENRTDFETSNDVPEGSNDQHESKRPILRASRKMARRPFEQVTLTAQEAPKRLSGKIERPAKKRVCRRSTPKRIVELRENLHAGIGVGALDSEPSELMSPVITFPASDLKPALCQTPKCHNSDSYLSETSCEDLSVPINTQVIIEPLSAADFNRNPIDAHSTDADELQGLKRLMKTPKVNRECEVIEENLGLRRLMETPRTGSLETIEVKSDLGLKRLMKTPKPEKQGVVEENLGLQRLMKTPKLSNAESVDGTVGLMSLDKTPEESKSENPESHYNGLKRLLKTPKSQSKEVEGYLGLKGLMKTPKRKDEELGQVENQMGLKRLMQTPKEKSNEAAEVNEDLGLQRLLRSSKSKNAPLSSPHLDNLFHDTRERKTKETEVKEKFGLKRLMATPEEEGKRIGPKYSLDVGSLPALFNLPKEEQRPVDDMHLHEVFTETGLCDADKDVTKQLKQESSVGDASVIEIEPTIRISRRGRRSVSKEAPKPRSTRTTRGKLASVPVLIEEDVVEVNRESHMEKKSGVLDSPTTTNEDEKDNSAREEPMKRQTRRNRMPKNDCPIENSTEESDEILLDQREGVVETGVGISADLGQKRRTRRQRISSHADSEYPRKPEKTKEMETEAQPSAKKRATRAVMFAQDEVKVVEEMNDKADSNSDTAMVVDFSGNEGAEAVTNDHDSVSGVTLPKRSTRSCRGAAKKNVSEQRRATRSAKLVEVLPSSPVVPLEEASSDGPSNEKPLVEENNIVEEICRKNTRSSSSRSKRKSIEQVVQEISGKKSRSAVRERSKPSNKQSENEKEVPMSGEKSRGRRRKVITDNVDETSANVGLVKGMVMTPPKMKFPKTLLLPIPEETGSQAPTPAVTIKETDAVEQRLPARTRSKRGRKIVTSSEEKDEPVAKRKASRTDRNDISLLSSEEKDCPVSIEPVAKVSCRQTRSRQVTSDVEAVVTSEPTKRKRQTRSASKPESTDTEISTEENESAAKRTRKGKSTAKPMEICTRRSTRLRDV